MSIPSSPPTKNKTLLEQPVGNIPDQAVSDEPSLHPFVKLVTSSFDNEFTRVGTRDRLMVEETPRAEIVSQKYLGMYTKVEFFAFFSAQSLEDTAREILTNDVLRSFHLNMTERVSVGLACMEGFDLNKFTDDLVESVGRNKPEPTDDDKSSSLINKEVLQSIFVQPEVLKNIFKHNFWILVMYVLLTNFQHTFVHAELVTAVFSPKTATKPQQQ